MWAGQHLVPRVPCKGRQVPDGRGPKYLELEGDPNLTLIDLFTIRFNPLHLLGHLRKFEGSHADGRIFAGLLTRHELGALIRLHALKNGDRKSNLTFVEVVAHGLDFGLFWDVQFLSQTEMVGPFMAMFKRLANFCTELTAGFDLRFLFCLFQRLFRRRQVLDFEGMSYTYAQ